MVTSAPRSIPIAMHRLPSHSALVRFRLAAYLFAVAILVLVGGLGYLGWAIFANHHTHIMIASGVIGAGVLTFIFQWVTAARARCQLCLVPSLSKKNCSKNRAAQRFLGSYRLKVATSIIFQNNFRCPYCNEPTVLEVRQRRNP